MIKKFTILLLILLAVVSCSSLSVAETGHKEKVAHEQTKSVHGDNSLQHRTPISYWIYLAGLAGLIFLSGKYIIQAVDKGIRGIEVETNDISLVLKLVLLAIFIYAIDQPAAMKHFHENSVIGFVRFILKFAAGIAMMIYSFSGMEEHH